MKNFVTLHGIDVITVIAKSGAELFDVRIDHAFIAVELICPEIVQDLSPAQNYVFVLDEIH